MPPRHIPRPAYVEDVDEWTNEVIPGTATYAGPSSLDSISDQNLTDNELHTISELEEERMRNERNRDIETWGEAVSDAGNTGKDPFFNNDLENAGKHWMEENRTFDLGSGSYSWDDNRRIFESTNPDLFNLDSQFSQGTEQPRREDRYAFFPLISRKVRGQEAMLQFQQQARDVETASNVATDGLPSPGNFVSSEENISTDDSGDRHDSPGKNEGRPTIKCFCSSEDIADIVWCRRCDTWQHVECYYRGRQRPDLHSCKDCLGLSPLGVEASEKRGSVVAQHLYQESDSDEETWETKNKYPDARLENGLRDTVARILWYGKLEELTIKRVRLETETKLGLKEGFFEAHKKWERRSKIVIRDEVAAQEKRQKNDEASVDHEDSPHLQGQLGISKMDIEFLLRPYYEQLSDDGLSDTVNEQQIQESSESKPTVEGGNEYIPLQSTAEVYTDSGYASNTARPAKALQIHMQLNQTANVSADDSDIQEGTDHEDDRRSIYSDASSLPVLRKTGYMNELANELAQAIQSYQLSDDIRDRIFDVLPELLKAFALSFGHPLSNAMQRDVMVFIHRYRSEIVATFKDHLLTEDVGTQKTLSKDKMSLDDIMNLWDRSGESAGNEEPNYPEYDETNDPNAMEMEDDLDEIDDNELPGIEAYRSIIRDAPGYNWLLDNLRRECVLAPPEPNVVGEIRNSILKALPTSPKISRRKPTEIFDMTFVVDCDPNKFLRDQEYTEDPEDAIGRAITLTCSTRAAQALTCGEYLRQTWPSTGNQTLELIKSLVVGQKKATVVCLDGTILNASSQQFHSQESPSICIDTRGTAVGIAEIGEQLAWLTSALRSSPYAQEVAYSRPFVDSIQIGHLTYEETPKAMYMCKIGVEIHRGERGTETTDGECWHNLFRTPVVVEGFPIPRRPEEHSSGIEIPLDIMAALTQTRRIHHFAGKTLLKGFADMLIPMKCSQGMVTWHLVHSKNGERISYLESEHFPTVDIKLAELERSRHILGWCPEMRTYAGAMDACYEVKNSRLPRPSDRGGLVDALLSSGHFVMGGTPFSAGRKDIRLRRNSYIMKIKWVSQKFVILWDVGEKRGWLVNGASALLHLVRGSLAQDQFDSRFGSLFSFNGADFQEALKPHQTDAALEILLNQNNLQTKIHSEDEGHVRFKDYVEDFYDLLEKMIDYQFKAVGTGHAASNVPRSLLEGWDFNDLTTGRDPVYPRQALLHQDGLSWVDFTRSVHAITLFGRGFGEVIQPVTVSCSTWTTLPKGRSYLAAGVTDLHKIMESEGDPYSIPVKLTHDILWYTIEEKSSQCRCKTSDTRCDLAQVLLPFRLHREMSASYSQLPEKSGAVIFGANSVHKWFWGDVGDPTKTPRENICLSSSSSSIGLQSYDSGIGRSLGSSVSRSSELVIRSVSKQYDEECPGSINEGISESEDYPPSTHTKSHRYRYNSPSARRYQIGIVCALHLELMAVRMLFDETHEKVAISDEDPNYYALGNIGGHNVVAVCLPHGQYGTNVAADVTSNMKRSFPALKFCLLVGVGAGVPSQKIDIRLGDVVISTPKGGYSGVLPYDMIKSCDSGVSELNGYLCPPPSHLMCAISELESDPSLSSTPLQKFLQQIEECKEQYKYPGATHDRLFNSQYAHKDGHVTCDECDSQQEIRRPSRLSTHPKLHYGLVASGNQVMRSAQIRDRLSREHNVLCFEMEGAGIMNSFPCLIIRGICDYADSHKNKQWQNYAAAVAAAYAKLLLSRLRDSNNGLEGGFSDSTSDNRQRSRKRRLSAESMEETLAKRVQSENY